MAHVDAPVRITHSTPKLLRLRPRLPTLPFARVRGTPLRPKMFVAGAPGAAPPLPLPATSCALRLLCTASIPLVSPLLGMPHVALVHRHVRFLPLQPQLVVSEPP